MAGFVRLRLSGLRSKLSAAAVAGLITTAVLTGLLLLTAFSAADVVRTAGQSQDRVRLYWLIDVAARDYQASSYSAVRDPQPATEAVVKEARARLQHLLAAAARLPAENASDLAVGARVARQGQIVVDQFVDTGQLVRRVDAEWREHGSRGALKEVNRITAPVFALEATLQGEILLGEAATTRSTARALRLIRAGVVAAFACLVLATGFSAVVQFLLRARLQPGLHRLEEGAQAFGAGKLDHRIALGGADELSRLSAAFDWMATTIGEKQAALHEVQLGLERAVVARTQELQQANSQLSAADERRRAFLADVSHELRTPLTVIRGETQVALRTADQPGFDPHDVFARILQQTRDLSRMVDDLFLIARAEAGGLPLTLRSLDLREIASRVASDFETMACEIGGSITASPGAPVVVAVDPDRLRRALASLIENALRHCQAGVSIEIEVWCTSGEAVIAVSDDGPGIDPAIAPGLFQRFRRGETRGEGSGLGLSLVSALVEAHGGRAYLEPRPCGGTRAVMAFPVGMPLLAAA